MLEYWLFLIFITPSLHFSSTHVRVVTFYSIFRGIIIHMERTRRGHLIELEALQKEVAIETFRSRGPGGQRRNKVETAVRLRHIPTGIVVVAREQRSQARNKTVAFERLKERLKALNQKRRPRRLTRVPLWAKRARREEKRRHARKKQLRQKVEV